MHPEDDAIQAFAEGRAQQAHARHIEDCSACRDRADEYANLFRALDADVRAPEALLDRVMAGVRAESAAAPSAFARRGAHKVVAVAAAAAAALVVLWAIDAPDLAGGAVSSILERTADAIPGGFEGPAAVDRTLIKASSGFSDALCLARDAGRGALQPLESFSIVPLAAAALFFTLNMAMIWRLRRQDRSEA